MNRFNLIELDKVSVFRNEGYHILRGINGSALSGESTEKEELDTMAGEKKRKEVGITSK